MSPSRLLLLVRDRASVRRYSPRTTQAYVHWIVRYVRWNSLQHPATLGGVQVRDFLTYLARERHVAASTQNQALAALQFLYRDVLEQPLAAMSGVVPARKPTTLPKVLSREAVQRVLSCLTGTSLLMAQLLYGSGLRLQECCQLRVKDLDFERGELRVRRGKGQRDRVTVLPGAVGAPLRAHLTRVRAIMAKRAARGGGFVEVPGALDRKIPRASRHWSWCWVFPAARVLAPRERYAADPPYSPDRAATCGACCRRDGRSCPTRRLSYVPAFLCRPPTGVGSGHQDRAGTVGAQRRENDDAVHARAEPRWAGSAEPTRRWAVMGCEPSDPPAIVRLGCRARSLNGNGTHGGLRAKWLRRRGLRSNAQEGTFSIFCRKVPV